MPQCIVIADDLTGANATGVLLRKLHLRTSTLMNMERIELRNLDHYDAVTYPTDSRAIAAELAYNRVFNAITLLKSEKVKLYNKRIDSTLRGNIGAEIDGILDGLGDGRMAIVIPSFPQAGRTAVGGYLLVNGGLLQDSDAAKDPKTPVNTSVIEEIVKKQTRYPVKSILLNDIYMGWAHIAGMFRQAAADGYRVIILDALQADDLDIIAEALIASEISYVTVDPGPFTTAVAKKVLHPRDTGSSGKILLTIGSVTHTTKMQLDELAASSSIYRVDVDTAKLIDDGKEREQEIQRVVRDILEHQHMSDIFCSVTRSIQPEFRLDLEKIAEELHSTEEELSLRINNSMAEITYHLLKKSNTFQGVFSSGGDITVALCRKMNASGMELIQEVIPLAAYGTLVDGECPGLKVVTKGGMVGNKDGIKQCIAYLKDQLTI